MKNKWIIGLVSTFLLVGCTSNDGESSSTDSGEEVNLSFYTWINEENGNWEETIAAYEDEHPGINIEIKALVENMSADDYLQKLDLEAASGEELDVVMFSTTEDLSKRVSAGMIDSMNSHIENEGLEIEEVYNMSAVPPSSDGTYYGLPSKLNTYLVMLNKDHLDEAGLPVPTEWTWDDYKEYAKALTTEDRFGSYLHTWPTVWHVLPLLSEPEENLIIKEDGSSNMDDPMLEASLKLRYELEQEDKTSEPYSNIISQQLNYRQQFFSEKASMIPIPSYMITEWGGFTPDFTIAWAPWPKNDENEPTYAYSSADIISIGQNSEHKEEAYQFARWLTTEGMLVQNKVIPAWEEPDVNEVLDNLVSETSKPEAVDINSLTHVLENSKPTDQFLPAGYMTEAYNAFNAEVELYLLGNQDLKTTLENAREEVQSVIDANKD